MLSPPCFPGLTWKSSFPVLRPVPQQSGCSPGACVSVPLDMVAPSAPPAPSPAPACQLPSPSYPSCPRLRTTSGSFQNSSCGKEQRGDRDGLHPGGDRAGCSSPAGLPKMPVPSLQLGPLSFSQYLVTPRSRIGSPNSSSHGRLLE